MELTTAIITALVLGATAGVESTAEKVVKDAYEGLKGYLKSKFPNVISSVEQLEISPKSSARRAVVAEDLDNAGVTNDMDLLIRVEALLDLVEKQSPQLADVIGVSLTEIKGASIRIADVRSTGSGVKIERSDFDGDISIEGVNAGSNEFSDPKG